MLGERTVNHIDDRLISKFLNIQLANDIIDSEDSVIKIQIELKKRELLKKYDIKNKLTRIFSSQ
jgi:hypothetical protein